MSSRFSFAPGGQGESDPWFRIGSVDVTTTMAVVLLSVVSIVTFALGGAGPQLLLAMDPSEILRGQAWRLVTWPFSNPGVDLWTVLNIFFFWYFGTELEAKIGRRRMLWLFVGFTFALTAAALVVGLLLGFSGSLVALGPVELMVLLVWIAENPTRKFFFGIPAWVFGALILALQVLPALGFRDWFSLLSLILGLVLCALVARGAGLLTEYPWVPSLGGGAGSGRRPKKARRTYKPSSPTVVAGPWEPPRARSDQARLDELLDKISERGMDGLSSAEKKELLKLREKRTRG